jgi:large conductance mechanosensitive channel
MSIIKEFKQFAIKGNVVDLAVGVIIGAAFGKIVTSFVDDLIMPPVGYVLGGIDFSKKKWVIKPEDPSHKIAEVSVKYGLFINAIIQFLIVAFCVFLLVKIINALRMKEEEVAAAAPPPKEEILLTEIRDILKSQQR